MISIYDYFLLTSNLITRIVNVSSLAAVVDSDFNAYYLDINRRKKKYSMQTVYGNSKRAQVLYSNELARKIKDSNVETLTLHPGKKKHMQDCNPSPILIRTINLPLGLVRTEIFRTIKDKNRQFLVWLHFWLLGKTMRQGAQTTIEAVVSDKNLQGEFLWDCRRKPFFVDWTVIGNSELEAKFFKEVNDLLNITYI